MKREARFVAGLLWGVLWLLPFSAPAQAVDPTHWGVYSRLLGARMTSDNNPAMVATWYWNADKSAIVEDQGAGPDSEVKPMGDGTLGRFVKGSLRWRGTLQADGAVIWQPEGDLFSQPEGGPFRVRLDGDAALLQEGLALDQGRVTKAWPWRRWVGSLPASAGAPPADDKAGPRALSEQDLARLRSSMARDRQQRAEALRRQAEEARRLEEQRRQQAEFDARMAAQRAEQEREDREEERRADNAFASALMGGLNTFKNELAKGQAERAQQQAFLANLQRQQQQAAEARQREQDRQRQAAAQEQLLRQQQAAAAQQQRQSATGIASTAGGQAAAPAQGSQAALAAQSARADRVAQADAADRQLRERAAAERQRLQQLQEQRRADERAAAQAPTPGLGSSTAQHASTHDDPGRCVSQPSPVRNPLCKDGSAFELKNACEQAVDARICIKTQDGAWDCGVSWGVRPGGTWAYSSCRGTSSVFMDVRSSGSNRRFADPP